MDVASEFARAYVRYLDACASKPEVGGSWPPTLAEWAGGFFEGLARGGSSGFPLETGRELVLRGRVAEAVGTGRVQRDVGTGGSNGGFGGGLRSLSVDCGYGFRKSVSHEAASSSGVGRGPNFDRNHASRVRKRAKRASLEASRKVSVGQVADPEKLQALARQRSELYSLQNEHRIFVARRKVMLEKAMSDAGLYEAKAERSVRKAQEGLVSGQGGQPVREVPILSEPSSDREASELLVTQLQEKVRKLQSDLNSVRPDPSWHDEYGDGCGMSSGEVDELREELRRARESSQVNRERDMYRRMALY